MFVSGLAVGYILAVNWFLLVAILVIMAMVMYAFRDKVDWNAVLKGEPQEPDTKKEYVRVKATRCPECGSTTKHRKECTLGKMKREKK